MPECSVEGCAKEVQSRGLCPMHYQRNRKYGDPLTSWPDRTGPCSVEGCDEKRESKGMCSLHYARFKRHGDPLTLVRTTQAGEPLAFAQAAILSSTDDCITWPFGKVKGGHGVVWIDGKMWLAHRYVLTQAKGEPPTPQHQAAHTPVICHNPSCINPGHLRWATPTENSADRRDDGTHHEGERVNCSRLTREDVLAIRSDPRKQMEIAIQYGITPSHISRIKSRKVWGHI